MSLLLVDVAIVGGGFLLGRWIVRTMRARSAGKAPAAADAKEPAAKGNPLQGFPCKIGDVLVRAAEGDEAWLAGALVFAEERPVAALFIAPEAGGDRAIFVRPSHGADVAGADVTWLAPVDLRDLPDLGPTGEPPHALEHGGVRYERSRRLPVKVERIGTGAPAVGSQAIVAEYSASGPERLLVVAGSPGPLAWVGLALRDSEYEVLPGEG